MRFRRLAGALLLACPMLAQAQILTFKASVERALKENPEMAAEIEQKLLDKLLPERQQQKADESVAAAEQGGSAQASRAPAGREVANGATTRNAPTRGASARSAPARSASARSASTRGASAGGAGEGASS